MTRRPFIAFSVTLSFLVFPAFHHRRLLGFLFGRERWGRGEGGKGGRRTKDVRRREWGGERGVPIGMQRLVQHFIGGGAEARQKRVRKVFSCEPLWRELFGIHHHISFCGKRGKRGRAGGDGGGARGGGGGATDFVLAFAFTFSCLPMTASSSCGTASSHFSSPPSHRPSSAFGWLGRHHPCGRFCYLTRRPQRSFLGGGGGTSSTRIPGTWGEGFLVGDVFLSRYPSPSPPSRRDRTSIPFLTASCRLVLYTGPLLGEKREVGHTLCITTQ